ncbi:MAG: hypothetical protein ACMG6S_28880, partial [Byssovorax sp.]
DQFESPVQMHIEGKLGVLHDSSRAVFPEHAFREWARPQPCLMAKKAVYSGLMSRILGPDEARDRRADRRRVD